MGASAPAITSAAATKWVDERRGCRIAMSPRVASRALAPDLARSTARKKGRRRVGLAPAAGLVAGALEPSTQREWTRFARAKNSLARLWAITCSARRRDPPAGRHQPESAEEKAAPAAGRMRAGTASDEEHGRYSLRQRYAGGVILQRHTEYRVHVTAA